MKFLVVVLAVAAVRAAPEADPALLYNGLSYAYPSTYLNPYAYNYALPSAPVLGAPIPAPVAPALRTVAPVAPVLRTVAPVAPVVAPIAPVYTPHDCVTPGGCNVRRLKDLGLVKREAEAEPEADAEAGLIAPAATLPLSPYFGLNPYSVLNYNYPYSTPYSTLNYANAYGYGLPAPVQTIQAVAPVQTVQAVAPAPIVKAIAAPTVVQAAPVVAPAPIVKAAPVVAPAPIVKAAPVVAVRAPVATPIVAQRTKKVTYTHLGRTPITPTDVLETETEVIGHTYY